MHSLTFPMLFLNPRFVLLLLSSLGALAGAQAPRGASASARLTASVDTISVTVETGTRVIPYAIAYQTLRPTMHGTRAVLERSYRWLGNDGSATADTLWLDAVTLAPISNHRHNGFLNSVTEFAGSSAHTRFTITGKPEQQADTTVSGALYASGELEELVRTSPLSEGYAASYTLYYGPPGRTVRPASIHVVGSQVISGRDGKSVDCWVVDAPLSEGLNTFYVAKRDHRVVRLVNHEDPRAAFVFSR